MRVKKKKKRKRKIPSKSSDTDVRGNYYSSMLTVPGILGKFLSNDDFNMLCD